MPKDPNIDLLPIIKEVFDSIFRDYGFELKSEAIWDGRGENVITASKGDMDLNFYLGTSPMYYYCSVGIKLSGYTAEKATSHVKYRSMGVSAIAKGLDPNYKRPPKGAQTKEEVKELFETEKSDLLKYCKDILLGDVSSWSRIAEQMAEKWEGINNKNPESVNKIPKPENKSDGTLTGLSKFFRKK
jgi:hypothetical protein